MLACQTLLSEYGRPTLLNIIIIIIIIITYLLQFGFHPVAVVLH